MALQLNGEVPTILGGGSNAGMGTAGGVVGGLLAGGVGGALAGALLGNRNGGGWGGNGGYGMPYAAPAATAVATDIVLNPAFVSLQNQLSNVEATLNAHNIDAGLTSVNQNISGTSRDLGRDIANLSTAQATGNFTTLNSINGLGRDIVASNTQALINSIQNFNQVQLSQQTATNQIIANLSAMSASQAACCCDIKQLIQSDGGLTRALINANTMQDLRDRNVTLAGEVSNFRQNQFLIDRIGERVSGVVV